MRPPRLGRFGSSVVVLATGCLVGVAAATALSPSPQDAAAQRAIPSLPAPSAQVTAMVMMDVSEGPCRPTSAVVDVPAPALDAGEVGVVTAVGVTAGQSVQTGTLLATVSGHPVVAVVAPYPFYRDLRTGDRGDDVGNLERALVAARLLPTADDTFDAATSAAVAAMHRAAGAPPDAVLARRTVVAVPHGATVADVSASLGQTVDAGAVLMRVSAAADTVTCDLDPNVSVSVGAAADLLSGQTTRSVIIRQVVEPTQERPQRQVTVAATDDAPLAPDGSILQIVRSQTQGEVTAVPVAALRVAPAGGYLVTTSSSGADGTTTTTDVPVDVGVTSGGYAQVTGEGLRAGDRVQLQGATTP